MLSKKFLFILFIGLVIRIYFIGNTGFLADISFWKSWSLAAADHGIVWASLNTNINYPPGFIYVLWLMGKVYSLIGDPHNFNDFWRQNNFGFLLVAKSIAIISDVAIASLIYWFFSRKEELKKLGVNTTSGEYFAHPRGVFTASNTWRLINNNLPLLLSSVFFLNPIIILDSAIWGQVESFGILFSLISIILLFYRHPLIAAAILTTGALMKLQNIIFIPIFFLFIWRYFDLPTMIKSLAVAAFTFFFLNFPFIWEHQMKQVLYLLTVNSDYFPWLSLNAHNLWWIVAGGQGMQVIDKITVLGILNAKTVGLLVFSIWYLVFSILVYLKPTPRNFLLSLTMVIFAFFLFTTQSHERYSYPVIVLLLFFYPFTMKNTHSSTQNPKSQAPNTKQISNLKHQIPNVLNFGHWNLFGIWNLEFGILKWYFWLLYLLLTLSVFFNIHTGLVINYPQNGFRFLTELTTKTTTIFNSYFLILLFFLFLPFVFSQISKLFIFVPPTLFVLAITILNLPYLLGKPVSLTKFKPIIIKQDYGTLQVNKAVDSFSGWKSWNRLSNNYFYYRQGFGTHANSNLVFDIDRKFKTLSTDFGVDTEAATPASVMFKIHGDGKELFSSKKLGRFDFPQHTEVKITGIKYLGLELTDAGDGINSDHADWLNPVLYK